METTTAKMLRRSFASPDETRPFEANMGEAKVVQYDGNTVGVATFKKGWRWSTHVKPIAGTDSCQAPHAGYVISGSMTVRMDDGTEETFKAGDLMIVPPGHDAWVDEDCVAVDWAGLKDYAKR